VRISLKLSRPVLRTTIVSGCVIASRWDVFKIESTRLGSCAFSQVRA
jgi:hypothetical protein